MDLSPTTRKYEGMFLIDNTQANKDWDAVVKHVHEILQKHNAEILSTEKWGEKKLAYKVKGQKRGTYLLISFNAPPEAITHINHDCILSEIILRCLIVSDLAVVEVPPVKEEEKATTQESESPTPIAEAETEVEVEAEEGELTESKLEEIS
ncbi:MAG: 30S ribosomal protein S6 [Candidatus Brocadiales bacterium]